MKIYNVLIFLFLVSALSACKNDENNSVSPFVLSGEITQNTTLKKGVYNMIGFVYVKNGATLTIEPGTTIKGDKDSRATLIITRGSKLIADGTPNAPIIFTSSQPAGQRAPGDWGGIVLLGRARINYPGGENIIEGDLNDVFGDGKYGGTNDADNSGVLRYVRIEYPGIPYQLNNEINGLTCGGVGSGTILEHIQVSFSGDDSFEFFGGAVNAKYLVSVHATDDNFDFDNGYSGKLQFVVAQQDPAYADNALNGLSNGVESDNDVNGITYFPITRPVISNMTLIGANSTSNAHFGAGIDCRNSSRMVIVNSVIIGFSTSALLLEGPNTASALANNASEFKNNLVLGITKSYSVKNTAPTYSDDIGLKSAAELFGNKTLIAAIDAGIIDAFNQTNPNFSLKNDSQAKTGAIFTGLDNFFTQIVYKGAFDINDWTSGWTNFNPQATVY